MAVPSLGDFSEYLTASREAREQERESNSEIAESSLLTVESLTEALNAIDENWRVRLAATKKTKVVKWIEAQPSCSRAWQAMFGKPVSREIDHQPRAASILEFATRVRTADDFLDYKHSDQAKAAKWANTPERVRSRVRLGLRSRLRCPIDVEIGVVIAFRDYLHTDRYDRIADEMADPGVKSSKMQRAIKELLESHSQFAPAMPPRLRLQLTKYSDELGAYLDALSRLAPPIERRDATARERLLAFDLWQVMIRRLNANKTEAVYCFLEFEGVQGAIDRRSLQRLIAGWRNGVVEPEGPRHSYDSSWIA